MNPFLPGDVFFWKGGKAAKLALWRRGALFCSLSRELGIALFSPGAGDRVQEERILAPPFMLSSGSIPGCHVQLGSEGRFGYKLTQHSQDQTSQVFSPAGAIPCSELGNQGRGMSEWGKYCCRGGSWLVESQSRCARCDGLLVSHQLVS